MATYKFEQFNTEIIDPTIQINPIVREVNPSAMTISVNITLVTPNGSKFGVNLTDVVVENLNYDSETLQQRVITRLEDYIV